MYPRFIEQRVREALSDTRVVLITGPRQAGKTTLAETLAHREMPFLTLDDQTTLDTARADPLARCRRDTRVFKAYSDGTLTFEERLRSQTSRQPLSPGRSADSDVRVKPDRQYLTRGHLRSIRD